MVKPTIDMDNGRSDQSPLFLTIEQTQPFTSRGLLILGHWSRCLVFTIIQQGIFPEKKIEAQKN